MNSPQKSNCYEYFDLNDSQIKAVEVLVSKMDIPEMVGQLFAAYMMEDKLSVREQIQTYAERLKQEVAKYHLGGYYLNRYYAKTTPQLVRMLQEQSKIPLFIGADMENGAGSGFGGVIADGLSTFPALMALGAAGSPHYAYQMGYWTGLQASLIGVNTIFSPSLDINNNPNNPIINVRSFGEDPYQVGLLGDAYIQGVQDAGGIPCAKHFPGHGNTSEDTHLQLCRNDEDKDTLFNQELVSFQRAIENNRIEMIMTAHISVPALEGDAGIPATFSSAILLDLLRQTMKFEGVIITDAMLMGGITTICGPGEAAVRAFNAGADIILMPPDLDAAYHGVLQAVENKEISEDRLIESVKRNIALKSAYSVLDTLSEPLIPIPSMLIKKADEISYHICCDAVTLVKNDEGCVPISPLDEPCLLFFQDERSEKQSSGEYVNDHAIVIGMNPDQETLDRVMAKIEEAEFLVIMADIQVLPEKDSVDIPSVHEPILQLAMDSGKAVILVSFGNPYLLNKYPDVDAYICGYRFSEQMFDAVLELIYGERIPHGHLPVTINEDYPAGHGLMF